MVSFSTLLLIYSDWTNRVIDAQDHASVMVIGLLFAL